MKKFISTIIALAMVLSMLPMTIASAAVSEELVSFGRPVILSDGTTAEKLSKMVDGISQSSNVADWINLSGDKFGYIDLGKVYDITKIGIWRRSTEETNGGTEPVEFTLWASENLLEAAPTAETATLLHTQAAGTYATDLTALSSSVKARYVYFDSTKSQGIHEIMVIAPSVTDSENILAGVSGVDKDGNVIEWLTDGDTYEYYTSIPKDNWFKYDLGAIYDFEYLYCEAGRAGTYHQAGFTLLANTEDNLETATTIVAPYINANGASINGYKKAIDGNYRYIWVMHDSIGDAYVDDLRIYGYPTTARTVQVDPRNYTNTIEWYADSACETPAEGSAWTEQNAWALPEGIHNFTQGNFKDGVVSNDGILAISAYTQEGTPTLEVDVPRITADGWYDVSYFAGGYSAGYANVTPIKITMKKGSGEEFVVSEHTPGARSATAAKRVKAVSNNHGVWAVSGDKVYLEKGSDYKMYITLYQANSSATRKTQTVLSRITLTPSTVQEVTADAVTTLEYEAYAAYHKEANEAASGGELIAEHTAAMGLSTNSISPYHINMPIEVEKAGRYSIKAVIGTRANSTSLSRTKVLVDGAEIIDNNVAGTDSSIPVFIEQTTFDLDEYKAEVYLTEGRHIISTTVLYRSTNPYDVNYAGFAADCITIERSTTPVETVIEFEDYADSITADIAPEGTDATDRTYDVWSTSALTNGQFGRYIGTGTSGHLSDSTYVARLADGIPADPGYVEFDIPVDIYVGGYYQTTMNIGGGANLSNSSEYAVELVDSNAKATPIIYTEGTPEGTGATRSGYSPYSGVMLTKVDGPVTYLNEGKYTLKFRLYGYKSNDSTKNDLLFCGDWLKITPATPYKLTDGELRVEWENVETANSCKYVEKDLDTNVDADGDGNAYNDYEIVVDVRGKASNDGVIYNDWGSTTEHTTVVNNFLVDVAEAGEYSIESVMAKYTGGRSLLTLKVNGETVYTNQGDGIDVSDTDGDGTADFLNSSYSMRKYIGKAQLNEGINEVALEIQAYATDKRVKYAADYVSFAPYVENPISQSEATRIEAEDYADEFAKAFGQTTYDTPAATYYLPTDSAVAKYIPTTDVVSGNAAMWAKEIETDAVMEIPVTVTESGTYKAKMRIGADELHSGYAASATVILVDKDGNEYNFGGGMIIEIKYAGGYPDGAAKTQLEPAVYASSAGIFSAYTGVQYVPAGEYTAKVVMPAGKYSYTTRTTQTNAETGETETVDVVTDVNKPMVLDYIEFSAAAPVATVGEKAEAEDYISVATSANDAASDGEVAFTGWSFYTGKTASLSIPVDVPEAGYYDIETVMTHAPTRDISNMVVSVGGTTVYNNVKPDEDVSDSGYDGTIDFIQKWFPMHKYVGNKVYLEKGINNVEFTLSRTFDNAFKFAIDYVKVTKSDDTITIADGKVTITATYDSSVVADAYMAFYKDGKLIKVEKAGGIEEGVGNARTDEPTEEYDYVKLLAWGKEIMPQATAIGFNVQK